MAENMHTVLDLLKVMREDRDEYTHLSMEATEPFMKRFWARCADQENQSRNSWTEKMAQR